MIDDELQTVAERKKNEAEISTRAFPLESPSKNYNIIPCVRGK